MVEVLVIAAIAFVGWRVFRTRRAHRSPMAMARGDTSPDYRPDPLAHLDGKPSLRSITEAVVPQPESGGVVARLSVVQSSSKAKPTEDDYQFEIEYVDRDGKRTKRRIAWVFDEPDGDDTILHAFCELAQADRKFRSSRIQSCKNLWTGRKIKDLGRYFRNGSYRR